MKLIVRAWNEFWFATVDASSLGVMRISLALILIVNHIHLWFFIDPLLIPDGPATVEAAEMALPDPRWSYRDYLDETGQKLVHVAELGVLIALLVGWKSRTMAWLSLLVQVCLYHRNPWMQNGGDRVMRLALLYIALVPCGACLSIDALRKGRKTLASQLEGWTPRVAHRLLQIQLVVIYAQSGWHKMHTSGWRDGSAVHDALSVSGYQRWPSASEAVLNNQLGQWFCMLGTWVTLFWELGFALLILWRPTRILALVLGVLVHGGIFMSMMVGAFGFIMLWTYQAWLPPDWPYALRNWWNERRAS